MRRREEDCKSHNNHKVPYVQETKEPTKQPRRFEASRILRGESEGETESDEQSWNAARKLEQAAAWLLKSRAGHECSSLHPTCNVHSFSNFLGGHVSIYYAKRWVWCALPPLLEISIFFVCMPTVCFI